MKDITKPIKATVGKDFLSKVDRIFDGSANSIFNELVQNARRAGATRLEVKFTKLQEEDGVEVEFTDNGSGIESPEVLLSLSDNGWSADLTTREDAAGMGFFVLSNFNGVSVQSGDWEMDITKEVFLAREEVTPRYSEEPIIGTRLKWKWPDANVDVMQEALQNAFTFAGIQTGSLRLPNHTAIELLSEDFIDEEFVSRDIPELGCRIGCKHADSMLRLSDWFPRAKINFKGQVISEVYASGEHSSDVVKASNRVRVEVRVDVYDARILEMVLPDRNRLRRTEAREKLMREIEKQVLLYVAARFYAAHTLPYTLYQRAKKLGIDIGEALACPTRRITDIPEEEWQLRSSLSSEEYRRYVLDRGLIVPPGQDASSFVASWDRSEQNHLLLKHDPEMVGYSWYDAIPQVQNIRLVVDGVTYGGEAFYISTHCVGEDQEEKLFRKVRELSIEADITHPKEGTTETLRVSTAMVKSGTYLAEWFDNLRCAGDVTIFLSKEETDKMDDPVSSLTDFVTAECYDYWGDSNDEDLLREFSRDCERELTEIYKGSQAAIRHLLERVVSDLPFELSSGNWSWTLRMTKEGKIEISDPESNIQPEVEPDEASGS